MMFCLWSRSICLSFLWPLNICFTFVRLPIHYFVRSLLKISYFLGLQFFDRLLLLFMPAKNQPNYVYLKYVPLKRVHLFTFIQVSFIYVKLPMSIFNSTRYKYVLCLIFNKKHLILLKIEYELSKYRFQVLLCVGRKELYPPPLFPHDYCNLQSCWEPHLWVLTKQSKTHWVCFNCC